MFSKANRRESIVTDIESMTGQENTKEISNEKKNTGIKNFATGSNSLIKDPRSVPAINLSLVKEKT